MADLQIFANNLRAAARQIDQIILSEARRLQRLLQTQAQAAAPVDSGDLRTSLKARVRKTRNGVKVQIGSELIYAGIVNRGKIRKSAKGNPVELSPALFATLEKARPLIEETELRINRAIAALLKS